MDLRILNDLNVYTPAPKPSRQQGQSDSTVSRSGATSDPVTLSPLPANTNLRPSLQTRLISEHREEIDNGIRLIKTFEQADGRTFTRAEEMVLTQNGARRAVIQQNPSGGITRYEEILDREDGGTFRRTQRFQDEAGDIATQISSGYQVKDPFILTGSGYPASASSSAPFQPMRGTQLDLQA